MPTGIWNLEFLNQNSQRKYPLTDDSTSTDTTGSFTLPDDFLVGLDLPVHAGMDVDPTLFFLMSFGIYSSGFVVVIGYQPATGAAIQVASASIPVAGFEINNTYALGGINDFADTVGKITIGNIDTVINEEPAGFFNFAVADSRIEPDCIRPIIRGISSISVASGTGQSTRLYGDIELVADQNIQLTTVIVAGQNPQIRISAIQGEGLAQPCICVGDATATPINRINGVPPTPSGDFTLLGNNCLKIIPITNGLQLEDTCSSPCCGCKELETITQDLKQFGTMYSTLSGFVNRLQSSVDQFSNVVLGSKLNDNGCVVCGG